MPYMIVKNAIFLSPTVRNESLKRAFINTCDAMIHARSEGERFGLACGEFVVCGNPVITNKYSPEATHLEMLGDFALTYTSPHSLRGTFSQASLRKKKYSYTNYLECTEEFVVRKFIDWVTG
jgi:hypothetical protein